MSSGWKLLNNFKKLKHTTKLLSAAAVTVAATAAGVSKSKKTSDEKDEIVFLSKEENSVPSKAKIIMHEVVENRDPILPNGDINWGCLCIEKDIVGPCNIEFRKLREYMHVNNVKYDFENFDEEKRIEFDKLFEDYIICTMDYPVYYEDSLLDEEKQEMKKAEELKKEEEKKKQQEKEANHRHFGKDEVVFLTKEENSIPSKAFIPKVAVEENRDPVLPNGEINWACTCIEKDVVGPCNIEFREFRKFVQENRNRNDDEEISDEGRYIIGSFLTCIRNSPVYYKGVLSKDDDDNNDDDDAHAGRKS